MSIYAVNGKEPIAAWVPSLDTAGNGTTTLTDLVGSNDGTLTNMDAGTDWVADTDSGGVRALDFDGVNDYVTMGNVLDTDGSTPMTVAAWIKSTDSGLAYLVSKFVNGSPFNGFAASMNSGKVQLVIGRVSGSVAIILESTTTVNDGNWHSLVWTYDGSRTAAGVELYADGSLLTKSVTQDNMTTANASNSVSFNISGRDDGANFEFDGLIDDVRIFNVALDATDVAYLAQSRGIVVATGNPVANLQNNLQSMRLGL